MKTGIFLSNNEISRYIYNKLKGKKEVLPVSFTELDFVKSNIVSKGDIQSFFNLLKKEKVKEFIFVGKIEPSEIFKEDFHISGKNFLSEIKKWKGEEILKKFIKQIENEGIKVIPLPEIFKEEIAEKKIYTRKLDEEEREDIETGFEIAKILTRYRIGQSLTVKKGMVIAVEGIEGTDKMIERTGNYVKDFVLIKIAGERKDLRFDLPVVGPDTIKILIKSGGKAVAVEGGKTIIFKKEEVISLCNNARISLIGL